MSPKPIILAFLMAHSFCASAQKSDNEKTNRAAQSVFVEVGGNGVGFSANYDSRFNKSEKGLGFRVGIGIYPTIPSILTIPVGINHLAGKAPHYFESGVGVTYVSLLSFSFFGSNVKANGIAFIPSIGYRYQPSGKGFTGRVFISPLIASGGAQFFGGLSGGFKF